MTPKERFLCALNLGIPDRVPTFELEFQLSEELCGKRFLTEEDLKNASPKEVERKIAENAETLIEVYTRLEHDAICVQYLNEAHARAFRRPVRHSGARRRNLRDSGRKRT